MLWLNNKKVEQVWIGAKRVAVMWVATKRQVLKIYEGIRSCYGGGRWISEKPWLSDDRWRY
ncbi:MAG: hypothetical protein NC131_19415 [Roseburia sp.]|nr:hypothetical protein [Roseburia sp.]